MLADLAAYQKIQSELSAYGASLVAVSKTKPIAAISELYAAGQRDFGENYVREISEKQAQLPADIHWHFIGHLQRNKVKQIIPFIHLIHGVDSLRLLEEINKQSAAATKTTNILLQVHIAKEESKFGLNEEELEEICNLVSKNTFPHIAVKGLMGMATMTENTSVIEKEFAYLHSLFLQLSEKLPAEKTDTLSMGMSSDYKIALANGSTMIRIGSALFGARV